MMRCDCEICRNNEDGCCLCEDYVRLDENGVCIDMERDLEKEARYNDTP